jgi:hypothetical protein
MLLEMASKWSKDYTSGIKKMQTQPIITEKHYADAYDWAKAIKSISDSQLHIIEVPAGDNLKFPENLKREEAWEKFEDFLTNHFAFWTAIAPIFQKSWSANT